MVERQLPKLHTRVRFPSPAPIFNPNQIKCRPDMDRDGPYDCEIITAARVAAAAGRGLRRRAATHRRQRRQSRAEMRGAGRADGFRCLLYTSDAADEEDSVDLGGR